MAIVKLSLVRIIGEMRCLDDVTIRCLKSEGFHPENPMHSEANGHGFQPMSEQNPYADILAKLIDLGVSAGINPKYISEHLNNQSFANSAEDGEQFYLDFYNEFHNKLNELRQRKNFLRSEIEHDEGALVYVGHLANMDVPFDEIFSCKYTKPRFGRLPMDSYRKLPLFDDKPFVFTQFDVGKEYCWGGYFCLTEDGPAMDDLFSSLYFERMRVPDTVHGTPEEALAALREKIAKEKEELENVRSQIHELVETRKESYYRIYSRVKFLSDSFKIRRYVSVLKQDYLDLFYITGYMPTEQAKAFADATNQIDGVKVELAPYDADKRLVAPTKLKNGWFAKPFEMFVEMYGLPTYGDVDPTAFVAFTYCLLFGIMFGDLGQGALLVLAGWLLWKFKKMNIGRVINRVGISSCIFGTLYGSVFGFEELLNPFFINILGLPGKPIEIMEPENTNLILVSAVGLGVFLIISAIIINIFLSLRKRDLERAFFSANGVAGLLFYGSLLFGAVATMLFEKQVFTPLYIILLVLIPLLVILFKEPLGAMTRGESAMPHDGMGSYILVGFFELFEVVLSFFSNTMSFLRVGGFVLSHAGMMMVVMTLSEMAGSSSSPIVIVIGNLFVIGMEGLIVGIQVLRLEFYELFSRYFDGDGKPFVPLTAYSSQD